MAWTVWVVLLLQLTSSRAGEATSGCAALLKAAESGDDITFSLHCRSHFSPKDCNAVRRSLGDRPWNSESREQTCQELLHELPEELEASIRKKETTTEQALVKDSDQLGNSAAATTARLIAPALTPSSTSRAVSTHIPSTVAPTTTTLPTPPTTTSKESSRTKAKAAEATTPTPEPEELPEVQPPSSPAPITFPATPPPSTHPATTTAATLPQLPAKEDEVAEENKKRKEEVRYEEDEDDEEDKKEKKAEEKVKQRVEEEEQDEKDAEVEEREREEEEEEDAEELAITGVAQAFPVDLPAPAAKESKRHERLVAKYQRAKQEPEPFVWYRAPHCTEYLLVGLFAYSAFACYVVSQRRPLTDEEEAVFLLNDVDDVV
ncbi:hypothetical protein AK812_SmicGene17432 [Symbiodinium microadriaticum]|uniref:Uncharacterized protein n=1 Tax=Symbiodinium microadriaticum TaxID=2951 RepID=A0A1Q9DXR4_SYMMI|nr:hypothetical protein AK812_SmicGene17432 [Symbiodinium microadriaticum]